MNKQINMNYLDIKHIELTQSWVDPSWASALVKKQCINNNNLGDTSFVSVGILNLMNGYLYCPPPLNKSSNYLPNHISLSVFLFNLCVSILLNCSELIYWLPSINPKFEYVIKTLKGTRVTAECCRGGLN